ncbi:hypothetical protein HYT17_03465 [Candidatus Microgenomates bacterium]|nr:hypothetical protein [Candidatus Microgenomates bacterium]
MGARDIEGGVKKGPEGGPNLGAAAALATPEPKTYPPQQVKKVRPGEDFSVDFNLDPERVKVLDLHTISEGEIQDVVLLEVEGTSVTGRISVVTLTSGISGDEFPVVVPGEHDELAPLYLLDVYLEDLPNGTRDGSMPIFSVTFPSGVSLFPNMSFFDTEGGLVEAMLNYWQGPGEDTPQHPGLSAHDLSRIRYRLELPQDLPPAA